MSEVRVLVTGGAGFLGSAYIRAHLERGGGPVLNLDRLTYAGSRARLADVEEDPRYRFVRADVCNRDAVRATLRDFAPSRVVHFAAESHVTRSEDAPDHFRRTNVEGTRVLLEEAAAAGAARCVHISTDEVYGPRAEGAFAEEDKPAGDGAATSPYAKSKALADDLAREFRAGMEVVVVRPTNCFGHWQHPEKAVARWVARGLSGRPLPVWGDGEHVRQWLSAEDLAAAILLLFEAAAPEPVYNVGPRHDPEIRNAELARWIAARLGAPAGAVVLTDYDRPQHDRRYAVDPRRIESLGWQAKDVWTRLGETIDWYRSAEAWWKPLLTEAESIYEDLPG